MGFGHMVSKPADSTQNAPDHHEDLPAEDLPVGSGVSVPSGAVVAESTIVPVAPAAPASMGSRLLRIALGLAPVGLLVFIAWADFPLCPFRLLVGVDCPGCGLTRATDAMVHLHFAEMLRIHPLAPIFAPLVLAFFGRATLSALGIKLPPLPIRVPDVVWLSLTVLLLGLWAARLAGLLGGTPDPIDFSSGLLGFLWGCVS